MATTYACPHCQAHVAVPAGTPQVTCGACRNVFAVGAAPPPPPMPMPMPVATGAMPMMPPGNMGAPPPPPQQQPQRRKALIVGINYVGQRGELGGCCNDANCLQHLFTTKFGLPQENIVRLTDDEHGRRDRNFMPTRQNIINGMRWLVSDVRPGDTLFFTYSGHGGSQQAGFMSDERDGANETLCPLDYSRAGEIIDDEINAILVAPLPPGARLLAIVDACHSGTVLDLPFITSHTRHRGQWEDQRGRVYKGTRGGEAVCISGCADDQTSADSSALSQSVNTGVMTFAFISAVEAGSRTWGEVLYNMHTKIHGNQDPSGGGRPGGMFGGGGMGPMMGMMAGGGIAGMLLAGLAGGMDGGGGGGSGGRGFSQIPHFSASEPFDLNRPFVI
ncbi:hypothetical protein PPROV_000572000 [Pycnococcus provasolii]|uniref:Peptidase C14 caspase domain-containing protein n=1 Tax=Pycnococcus provasolii TaxID=41880 RepID=A0A830HI20_9CHLO|nr:hypothetical protein PPROV_000572000 [Pycnococcus provasolii]